MLDHHKARSKDRTEQQEIKQHLTSFIDNAQSILIFFHMTFEVFKYTNTFIVIKCKCNYTNFLKVFNYFQVKCISPTMSS